MADPKSDSLFETLSKAIIFAAAIFIFLWLLYKTLNVILLLAFALVLVLIINDPVARLQKRNIKRIWACAIVFGIIFLCLFLLGWLIVPKVSNQLQALITNLPDYANQLSKNVSSWSSDYPEISKQIEEEGVTLSKFFPSVPKMLVRLGNYSLSVLGVLIILIAFISMVVYAVANPRPLLEIYFSFFPPTLRDKAETALKNTSTMVIGWIRANLIGGSIEAVLVTVFLSYMNVPGAWVWGALTLFAELIPRIGFYIMSIPPVIVALAVSPITALWVLIFFLALNEVMGDFVMPKLRSSTMNIHPVSILFLLLAMGAAFGFTGVLLATPLAAIIKAYYEEFYLIKTKQDTKTEKRIDNIILRN